MLISDDDRDSCIHASLLLEKMGIRADWVMTGGQCVEKVRKAHEVGEDYDVCIIDWKMPDMDGIQATRRIRDLVGPDTLIIIITAYDWSAIDPEHGRRGQMPFLQSLFLPPRFIIPCCPSPGLRRRL